MLNIFHRLPKLTRHRIGRTGEDYAVKLLKNSNCQIFARNWRFSYAHDGAGELDIVALDGETLIFVEVKTRSSLDNYLPGANLSDEQKKRIRRGALTYCRKLHIHETVLKRFDLVEVIYDGKTLQDIAWHRNYMPFFKPARFDRFLN